VPAARQKPGRPIAPDAAEDDPYVMPSPATSPVIYIECDVPDGMTLADWRRRDTTPQRRGSVHDFTRWARTRLTR
jgi:hypothetical protein